MDKDLMIESIDSRIYYQNIDFKPRIY